MRKIIRKSLFPIAIFVLFFALLENARAQGIVPCGNTLADPCTLCHFIVGIKNLIDFGLRLLVTAAFVAIFISGVMYIVSAGSELVSKAKKFLTAALIGFTVVLGGWFIVNVAMWVLSAKADLGIEKANWYTFTCSTSSSTYVAPTSTPPGEGEPTPEGYTFDDGIEAQMSDASNTLKSLLNCMQPQLPTAAKRISSISDSAGIEKCSTGWSRPPCAHTKNSCHYGGRKCTGQSYAVDFGNEAYASQIMSVARSCGGRALDEGNHIHVSIGDCGCDEGL